MTSKEKILEILQSSKYPLAVHEFNVWGYNQNNIATRLSELQKEGKVFGKIRSGTHYKEWSIIKSKKFEENGQGILL